MARGPATGGEPRGDESRPGVGSGRAGVAARGAARAARPARGAGRPACRPRAARRRRFAARRASGRTPPSSTPTTASTSAAIRARSLGHRQVDALVGARLERPHRALPALRVAAAVAQRDPRADAAEDQREHVRVGGDRRVGQRPRVEHVHADPARDQHAAGERPAPRQAARARGGLGGEQRDEQDHAVRGRAGRAVAGHVAHDTSATTARAARSGAWRAGRAGRTGPAAGAGSRTPRGSRAPSRPSGRGAPVHCHSASAALQAASAPTSATRRVTQRAGRP